MRTIPEALLAVQGRPQLRPAVRVEVWGRRFGIWRPAWRQLYAGSESAHGHDAGLCADGALVRARVDENGYLQVAHIPHPDDPDEWCPWQVLATADDVAPAVIAHPTSDEVHILWVGTIHRNIRWARSTDGGMTWSTPAQILSEPTGSSITALAGVFRGQSPYELYLFYALDAGGAGADDVLKVVRYANGYWGAPSVWSCTPRYSFSGLDALWQGDFWLVAAGRDGSSPYLPRLWMLAYGDGWEYPAGIWAALTELEISDTTQFQFTAPAWCAGDAVRLSYLERWDGTNAYRRACLRTLLPAASLGSARWTEAEPADYAPAADVALRLCWDASVGRLYLIGHDRAWCAALQTEPLELGERVVAYEYRELPAGGGLVVVLDNRDGALSRAGQYGSPYAFLRPGAELRLARGAWTAGGPQYADLPAGVVTALEWREYQGTSRLVVRAEGWWEVLRGWRAGRLFSWDGTRTTASIGADLLALVGLDFAADGVGSDLMNTCKPRFVVPAGQDGATALRRLMANLPDLLRFDGYGTVLFRDPGVLQTPFPIGGQGEPPVLEGVLVRGAAPANLYEACSEGVYGRALDLDAIRDVGTRRRIWPDAALLSFQQAEKAAEGMLRHAGLEGPTGWLCLRPLWGVELWDILRWTRWDGSRCDVRVMGVRERYDARRQGLYEQRLTVVALPESGTGGGA